MSHVKHLPEPFRIRVVEPIALKTLEERQHAIKASGLNPFALKSEDVFIDLLTDSGTGAITNTMQAAGMLGDEAYAGSKSYYKLSKAVKDIFDFEHTIPTHQGRGAEQIIIPTLIEKRRRERGLSNPVSISNWHFDTTQGHTQINGAKAVNVVVEECMDTAAYHPFKGNFDIAKLEAAIQTYGPENVYTIISTITNNSAGGQPVSMANLKAVYEVAQRYDIPVIMDSARFCENAYFIQQREPGYQDKTIAEIIKEMYQYADMLAMSAKKDALVRIGGLLCVKDDNYLDVFTECRSRCVAMEGFPTYGGMSGQAIEELAQGLYEGQNKDYLAYRTSQVAYLTEQLEAAGVPCQTAGGHAVFVDAGRMLPHIPGEQFPAHALACKLYELGGIRAVEIGSLLLGRDNEGNQIPAPMELLRLTIPRMSYTQSHCDYIVDVFKDLLDVKDEIKGLRLTYEPPVLRHFTATFEEVE
ncbi:tryptophanase [Paraferrimonas sedimenticola]|uniref:Tryptophanase n=1 Tax=Paraferrimonas sedimenticola TaxID=375674 RepID=A0AA37RWK0_9GAMM|nr:tryptophanase [Paraferrimonas sedimenticola]GLP96383.1 tryptophanase [Paraferrimonas sedimenticola]